mmetsp:Transcript_13702/g.39078  ORF Transcript_13702/g.39078 Transcript_13702/m.39078 type:complete len:242 (+) Transcript_13702:330-1055(+)
MAYEEHAQETVAAHDDDVGDPQPGLMSIPVQHVQSNQHSGSQDYAQHAQPQKELDQRIVKIIILELPGQVLLRPPRNLRELHALDLLMEVHVTHAPSKCLPYLRMGSGDSISKSRVLPPRSRALTLLCAGALDIVLHEDVDELLLQVLHVPAQADVDLVAYSEREDKGPEGQHQGEGHKHRVDLAHNLLEPMILSFWLWRHQAFHAEGKAYAEDKRRHKHHVVQTRDDDRDLVPYLLTNRI